MQNMFARSQVIGPEVGARAIRLSRFEAPQRNAIRLAGLLAGNRVIGPRLVGIQ